MRCEANGCVAILPRYELTDVRGEPTNEYVTTVQPGWGVAWVERTEQATSGRLVVLCPKHAGGSAP